MNNEYEKLLTQLRIKPEPKPDDIEYENDIMTINNYTIYKTIAELKKQINESEKEDIQPLKEKKQELLEKKRILGQKNQY